MDTTVAPTSTPSVTSTTPTAAPATSAPSSPVSTGQRPTFAEAFASDAAPTSISPVTPEEPAATVQGTAETTTSAPAEPEPGPMPFKVHKTALENARTKAREEARLEFQQQYGWAQTIDRASLEQGAQLGQMYQQDRPGFIRQVLSEAMSDPEMAPLIRSEAARALGARTAQPQPQADLSPDIPVMDQSGNVVAQTYSADRVQAIVAKAVQDALGKEIAPLQADFKSRQDRDAAVRQHQEFQATVNDIYSEATDVLPGFKEHEAKIAEVFATIPGDPAKALRKAWQQVVGSTLARADQVKADQLKELQTKAAASGINPASAVIPSTKRPRSFNDPSLSWT